MRKTKFLQLFGYSEFVLDIGHNVESRDRINFNSKLL